MALDPRLILAQRLLPSVAEQNDERQKRLIQQQEVQLRAQDIQQRGEEMRQAAMDRAQARLERAHPSFDPKKADEELTYQLHLGDTIHGQLVAAQKDPSVWPVARQNIARLAGPQAIQDLPEDWETAAPIVDTHVKSWEPHKAELKATLQKVTNYDPETETTYDEFVDPNAVAGQRFLHPPAKATATKTAAVGSFEDYLQRTYGDNPTAAQILEGRRKYNTSDDKATSFAAGDVTMVTPAAVDLAALNYRKTGVMPPLGMGDKSTRQKILNRAAALTPDDIAKIEVGGTDIAANKANYGADSASLKKLQGQRDAITAFENTAQKNIDIFLETAGKAVDTGSPMVNSLARTISGQMLGSPNQASYDAARQVALSEIARIVQNPSLTGTLSDSARHEIETFNPSNATLGQSVAVMRLLKRDMGNRKQSLDDAITDVKKRIGGSSSQKTDTTTTQSNAAGLSYADYLKSKGKK